MKLPYRVGAPVPTDVWAQIKIDAIFGCCKWDIQSEDHCVLADFPVLLTTNAWAELSAIAEALSRELLEAERELLQRPDLHKTIGIPGDIRRELAKKRPQSSRTVRVMRFDFHFTDAGWKISEVNADVPGGFIEASGFTHLMAQHFPGLTAPPSIAQCYCRAVERVCPSKARTVAMIHATAYKDDRQVMEFLSRELSQLGCQTLMASPEHLGFDDRSRRWKIRNTSLDAIVRFYPAEWLSHLSYSPWRDLFAAAETAVCNPTTAMVIQSKRFPLVWDALSTRFETWKDRLPETICSTMVDKVDLNEWVLKPAYGRVGEDVLIFSVTSAATHSRILKAAGSKPEEWVLQRRFHALPLSTAAGEFYPSLGVFTLDGVTAGVYGRIAKKPLIDHEAQDIAVLIDEGVGNS